MAIAWATLRFPYWVSFDSHTIHFWTLKMEVHPPETSPLPLSSCPSTEAWRWAGSTGQLQRPDVPRAG